MPRRRPRPLVVDSLLALVLAVAALALTASDRPAEQSSGPATESSVNAPPRDVRAGDVWNARIAVFRDGEPQPLSGKAVPLLTVQNTMTGRWTTTEATPTGVPGFYRARVVFPERGDYAYSVLLEHEGVPHTGPDPPGTPAGLVLLTLLATLPIALRRRAPLPVLGVTLAAALAADLAYDSFPFPGPLVALYTVGAYAGRPRSLVAAAATAAALPLLLLGDSGLGFWEILGIYAVFGAVWLLGDNLRTRRDRASRLEAERQANIGRAAAEEQARMARELHDIIGHSVSVMTIQAAAAGDAFDHRPAEVREALRAIESTGRETLAELRRLLAGVRPGEAGAFAPAPGLERPRRAGRAACGRRASRSRCRSSRRAGAAAERRLVGLSHRAGGAHQHAQARPTRRPHGYASGTSTVRSRSRSSTTGRERRRSQPGHGILGMRERAAPLRRRPERRSRAREAGSRSARASRSRSRRGDHPRAARRRPGARPQRLPADPRDARRPRGRRRGAGRARGGRARAAARART